MIDDIVADQLLTVSVRDQNAPQIRSAMEFLLQNYNYFWLLIAVISGAMLFVPLLRGNPDGVSPQQAVLLLNRENAVIIDVREQYFFV